MLLGKQKRLEGRCDFLISVCEKKEKRVGLYFEYNSNVHKLFLFIADLHFLPFQWLDWHCLKLDLLKQVMVTKINPQYICYCYNENTLALIDTST